LIENPAVVESAPGSAAHTRKSNSGTPPSLRFSPNTTHGTDKWNGLMPSKAITATMCGPAGTMGLDMDGRVFAAKSTLARF
jgi:hypothetical protein